jgi:predicted dehydrogenase
MKVAFIGAGRIAESHLKSLARVGGPYDLQISGFFDPDRRRAQYLAGVWGGEAFASEEALLESPGLEAVYVVSPTPFHHDQAMRVVERRYALFLEKPVSLEESAVLNLRRRIEETGIIHCIGLQWRYRKLVQRLKKRLDTSPPSLLTARWLWFTPPVQWLRRSRTSGGQVFDQLIHIVDLFRYLAGDVRAVSSLYNRGLSKDFPDFDNWDVNSLQLSLVSGAIANLACTYKLNVPMEERVWIEIISDNLLCTLGTRRLILYEGERQQTYLESGDTTEDMVGRDELEDAFLRSVSRKDQRGILTGIDEAHATMEVLFAAHKSAEIGQPVQLE